MTREELKRTVDELVEKQNSGDFYIMPVRNGRYILCMDSGKRFVAYGLRAYESNYAKLELEMLIPTQFVMVG